MEYTDMERRILDMWPKFEDGNYVQLGDKAVANSGENAGKEFIVRNIYFEGAHGKLRSSALDGCYWNWKSADTRVERPAPKVLDADGVEIKVGDTVWSSMYGDNSFTVSRFAKNCEGETLAMVNEMGSGLPPSTVTHARPDSWERLERDAEKSICDYFGSSSSPDSLCEDGCPGLNSPVSCGVLMKLDLISRAKAIAEKEAGR